MFGRKENRHTFTTDRGGCPAVAELTTCRFEFVAQIWRIRVFIRPQY